MTFLSMVLMSSKWPIQKYLTQIMTGEFFVTIANRNNSFQFNKCIQCSNQAIGTLENINFPEGVGLYIALECYREFNRSDCAKLFEQSKKAKQKSCGKVMTAISLVVFYLLLI